MAPEQRHYYTEASSHDRPESSYGANAYLAVGESPVSPKTVMRASHTRVSAMRASTSTCDWLEGKPLRWIRSRSGRPQQYYEAELGRLAGRLSGPGAAPKCRVRGACDSTARQRSRCLAPRTATAPIALHRVFSISTGIALRG